MAFGRVLAERLTRELRAPVSVDIMGTEQLSYDSYVRSMPNPSIITILALDPLPGLMLVELSPQLGLTLVDRMLGGPGRPVPPRQPTQLEQTLLGAVLEHPVTALKETFEGVVEIEPRFVNSELNPSFAHATNPTEMVLVLTFSLVVESTGPSSRGLLSLCYPLTVLNPIRDAIRQARWSGGAVSDEPESGAMTQLLPDSTVELAVHTRPTRLRASELVGLRPGDVITFDHGIDEPLVGSVEDIDFMLLSLGRQGSELAARLEEWTT
jgi:flagellar motor switch protein FliM